MTSNFIKKFGVPDSHFKFDKNDGFRGDNRQLEPHHIDSIVRQNEATSMYRLLGNHHIKIPSTTLDKLVGMGTTWKLHAEVEQKLAQRPDLQAHHIDKYISERPNWAGLTSIFRNANLEDRHVNHASTNGSDYWLAQNKHLKSHHIDTILNNNPCEDIQRSLVRNQADKLQPHHIDKLLGMTREPSMSSFATLKNLQPHHIDKIINDDYSSTTENKLLGRSDLSDAQRSRIKERQD